MHAFGRAVTKRGASAYIAVSHALEHALRSARRAYMRAWLAARVRRAIVAIALSIIGVELWRAVSIPQREHHQHYPFTLTCRSL